MARVFSHKCFILLTHFPSDYGDQFSWLSTWIIYTDYTPENTQAVVHLHTIAWNTICCRVDICEICALRNCTPCPELTCGIPVFRYVVLFLRELSTFDPLLQRKHVNKVTRMVDRFFTASFVHKTDRPRIVLTADARSWSDHMNFTKRSFWRKVTRFRFVQLSDESFFTTKFVQKNNRLLQQNWEAPSKRPNGMPKNNRLPSIKARTERFRNSFISCAIRTYSFRCTVMLDPK